MYLSITGVTADNKLAKYRGFENEADADAHAVEYNGFVVEDPGGIQGLWVVDPVEKTVTRDVDLEQASELTRAADRVQINRRNAYDSDSDHLFFSWQAGESSEQDWLDARTAVKVAHPKPE